MKISHFQCLKDIALNGYRINLVNTNSISSKIVCRDVTKKRPEIVAMKSKLDVDPPIVGKL